MNRQFTAFIEKDKECGMYIGAHTCAETIDELQQRLIEVVSLCLEEMESDDITMLPEFSGNVLPRPLLREIRLSVEEYNILANE